MTDTHRAAASSHVAFAIQRLGAQLGPAVFVLPDGRQVSPLQVSPWAGEAGTADLPGVIRSLRGEWPCVPFGFTLPVTPETPARWAPAYAPAEEGEEPHGHSSNHDWTWEKAPDGALSLSIRYPDGHPVDHLHRTVRAIPGQAALEFSLTIAVRAECALPLGLHFTFALPGAARIEPGAFRTGRTYPGTVEPGASLFAIDHEFADLTRVPTRGGGTADGGALPLPGNIEELLQLDGVDGTMALAVPSQGYRARIAWDRDLCPSVLLWFSNRGRTAAPWNGRHLALGMEPVCSPFGLGPATARRPNPVSDAGTPTARPFRAGEVLTTTYRLSVEPLEGD
jgi:hypothetical protein